MEKKVENMVQNGKANMRDAAVGGIQLAQPRRKHGGHILVLGLDLQRPARQGGAARANLKCILYQRCSPSTGPASAVQHASTSATAARVG